MEGLWEVCFRSGSGLPGRQGPRADRMGVTAELVCSRSRQFAARRPVGTLRARSQVSYLTLQDPPAKCNGKVRFNPLDAGMPGPFDSMHESGEPPTEQLLQRIWAHQRLRRLELSCVDGRSVRVLHPGFLNRGPGPDFLNAVLQFGVDSPEVGDVEVDVCHSGWRDHNHEGNPDFGHVLLRVVWAADSTSHSAHSMLPLKPFLDAPLPELALWMEGPQGAVRDIRGRCCDPLASLDPPHVSELILGAARARFRRKAFRFHARARSRGWEAALWEGVFGALGYHQNAWPMLWISEQIPELMAALPPGEGRLVHLQSRLLGVAGFLESRPFDTLHSASREQRKKDSLTQLRRRGRSDADIKAVEIRLFWDHWWRDRDQWSSRILPPQVWRFASTRPMNRPERRLALASHWLLRTDFARALELWMVDGSAHPERRLLHQLQPGADPYWESHWTLEPGAFRGAPVPLLGAARVGDLAMNVFLPWLWARAVESGNAEIQKASIDQYLSWPAGQDNSVLKLARERLFGGRSHALPETAASQQGMLQVVADFCRQSNALCESCQFPRVVDEFRQARKG